MTALKRIPKRSLSVASFEQIRDGILDGSFAPGQPLPPERMLCARLGVSRTAVREALARLEQCGLVAVRHGGETSVRDFRTSAGLDLLPQLAVDARGRPRLDVLRAAVEMRVAVAPDVARLAAQRSTAAVDAELAAIVTEMDRTPALSQRQELSMSFWAVVVRGADNLAYQLAFNSLGKAYDPVREKIAAAMKAELEDVEGYRAIARAIAARDPVAAEAAARAHITIGLAPTLELFAARGAR
jgi:GntR family transcriptional repressor for pyruvate dehydrogenase complex